MASTVEEPRTTEQVPNEQTNAQAEAQRITEGVPVKIGYVLAAIALIGLCVGAVVAVVADSSNVTTGGTIAAISAGLLAATGVVGMLVVYRRKGVPPVDVTESRHGSAASSNGKSRTSPASSKRPTAARS
jgi:hypothetical protein